MNLLLLANVAGDDKVAESATALIAGMGTVFVILILISFIISAFKYLGRTDGPSSRSEIKMKAVIEASKPAQTFNQDNQMDDMELVAVLTAAIAASLNTTTDKLRIKSFRRISGKQMRR